MGSPVSVTVANLVMEDVEERALTSFPSTLPFWKRYVDDTCTALRLNQLAAFHKHCNSMSHPSISRTSGGGRNTQVTHHPDGTQCPQCTERGPTWTDTLILTPTTFWPTHWQSSRLCSPELTHTAHSHQTRPRNNST